jgi:hypothetical protein
MVRLPHLKLPQTCSAFLSGRTTQWLANALRGDWWVDDLAKKLPIKYLQTATVNLFANEDRQLFLAT